MKNMFSSANSFDGDLSTWDVSSVTDMSWMFSRTERFNKPLNDWNTSSVTDMSAMFYRSDKFNQDLDNWNTSSVTDMNSMFAFTEDFNGNISTWDVSNVEDMSKMFRESESFNQDLSNWDISSVTDMSYMFYGTHFSTGNYDKLLRAWSLLDILNEFVDFTYNDITYCYSEEERQLILDTYSWDIDDAGLDPSCEKPNVTLIFPTSQVAYSNFDLIVNFSHMVGLKNVTIKIWNSSNDLVFDDFLLLSGLETQESINVNIPSDFGFYNISYDICSLNDICSNYEVGNSSFIYYPNKMSIKTVLPSEDSEEVYVLQNEFFKVGVNLTCEAGVCENINLSLDPAAGCDLYNQDCTSECASLLTSEYPGTDWVYEDWSWGDQVGGVCTDYDYYTLVIMEDDYCDDYDVIPGRDGDCVYQNLYNPSGTYGENGAAICTYSCPSYERNGDQSVSIDDCYCDWGDCASEYCDPETAGTPYNFDHEFFRGSVPTKSLVPMNEGNPFYTNTTNPILVNLSEGESETIEWYVNATGELNTSYEFFAFSELLENDFIEELTHEWRVFIVDELPEIPEEGNDEEEESESRGSFSIPSSFLSRGPVFDRVGKEVLKEGYNKVIPQKNKIEFSSRKNQRHSLSIDEVKEESVKVTVSSEPQTKELIVGEEWKVDLEFDGIYDISVKLNSIINNSADITLKEIEVPYQEVEEIVDLEKPSNVGDTDVEQSNNKSFIIKSILFVFILLILFLLFLRLKKYKR